MATSLPEDSEVVESEQRRCTYCFQELNEMRDPRQLPCTHIVCMTCLQNDWKLEKLQCRACSASAEVANVESLPKVKGAAAATEGRNQEQSVASSPSCFNCDVCKTPTAATTYCVECEKKSCTRHTEYHEEYFQEDGHKVLDIKMFEKENKSYEKAICELHPTNIIRHACRNCLKMPCSYCEAGTCDGGKGSNSSKQQGKNGKGGHVFKPVAEVAGEIRKEIQLKLISCSKTISDLCKLEKQTWFTADELAEKCKAMNKRVDETTEKQLSAIQGKADTLKQEIQEYYSNRLGEVEQYIKRLNSEVENLEQTHMCIAGFINHEQPSTVIQQKVKKMEELSRANQNGRGYTTKPLQMIELSLHAKATASLNDIELVLTTYIPEKLTYSAKRSISQGTKIHSISFASHGRVAIGCGQFILNYDSEFQLENYVSEPKGHSIYSVQRQSPPSTYRCMPSYYYQSSANSISSILVSLQADSHRSLFYFTPSSHHSQVAVTSKYIVISNVQSYHLMIYDLVGAQKSSFNFNLAATSWIRSLCFDANDDLLVLDPELGCVSKYQINDGGVAPKLLWRYGGIAGPYAMCINSSGHDNFIYVSSTGQKLHILQDGKLVGVMHNYMLPDLDGCPPQYTAIAVWKNRLLTSQNATNTIREFEMK